MKTMDGANRQGQKHTEDGLNDILGDLSGSLVLGQGIRVVEGVI